MRQEPFTISGVLNVTHSRALIGLESKTAAQPDVAGRVCHVGRGVVNSLSMFTILMLQEKFFGIRTEYRRLPPRESDQHVCIADFGKDSRVFGWTSR